MLQLDIYSFEISHNFYNYKPMDIIVVGLYLLSCLQIHWLNIVCVNEL